MSCSPPTACPPRSTLPLGSSPCPSMNVACASFLLRVPHMDLWIWTRADAMLTRPQPTGLPLEAPSHDPHTLYSRPRLALA